ncbi:hypothetical protein BH10PLA2_BH10PLA2_07200 [soil metagenome]
MIEDVLNHPPDEILRALSLGMLAEGELTDTSAHLGNCLACCRRIDELSSDDRLLTRLQQSAATHESVIVSRTLRRPAVRALRQSRETNEDTRIRIDDAVPLNFPAPRQIGDYEILAEVGRGGMGVVFKARHRSLHRLAALKMVLAGEFATPTQELRFRLEAELAARVQHPNIVQVYEIGSYESRPFLALEWIDGGSLADRLKDGKPWPPTEAAALIETLARAIDVAHSQGVVHRDLKTGNILLQKLESREERGENRKQGSSNLSTVPSISTDHRLPTTDYSALTNYAPKITDFGLAQTIEGRQSMTRSGFLVGTPGYMAPEQAGGKRALVGPTTDIYSLGVILYELLTAQLPFKAENTLELLQAVTTDEPPRPRRLQPGLPRDLEAITLHCLEKEPGRRYPTALALAEDLRRFQEGTPVAARPAGTAARLVRACRRRPLVAALCGLLFISLLGGLGGVTWQWLEANQQRDLANEHAHKADGEKQAALYQAYRASLSAASAAIQNHDVADAARHLRSAPEDLRGWEWRHLHSRLDDSSSVIAFGPESSSFLAAAPLRVGSRTASGLRLTNLENGSIETLPIRAFTGFSTLSGNQTSRGLRVAAWYEKSAFELFNEKAQVLCRVKLDGDPRLVVMSPDGSRFACYTDDGNWYGVTIFDATSSKPIAVCQGHRKGIYAICFSPNGKWLATGGEDKAARVWDVVTGALLVTCQGHVSKILGVEFSPDGTRIVTTSSDGTARQWDPRTGQEVEPPYDRHTGEVLIATYSPDGQWVASAAQDRTIRVWRAIGRHDAAILQGHTGDVRELRFSKDGRRLASLSGTATPASTWDDTARVWDIDFQSTLPVLRGHSNYIYPVAYSPDGRWLASGSWDGTVRIWDAATGEPCASLAHPGVVLDMAFTPDGKSLATGGAGDELLRIWDVATARVTRKFPLHSKNFHSVAFTADGCRVAANIYGPENKSARMTEFDTATGVPLFTNNNLSLAYSPDGHWLAALAADETTVLLLDAKTHAVAARFSGHEKIVFKAAFSPDSRSLATSSRDHTVRVWTIDEEIASGKRATASLPTVLRGHSDEVYAVAFHPDGTRLATAGRDGAVWLWDPVRGEEVMRLAGHKAYVWSLAFSPDGTTLASGSGDTTVRLWDTAPLKTRFQARREAAALKPEAERLVEKLWDEKRSPDAVVEALRADQSLSAGLRQACFRAVLRKVKPSDSNSPKSQGPT